MLFVILEEKKEKSRREEKGRNIRGRWGEEGGEEEEKARKIRGRWVKEGGEDNQNDMNTELSTKCSDAFYLKHVINGFTILKI